LIEGRGLAVMRGEQLLFSGLDISLEAGDIVRLTGPNGSGKTTLLRVLCGLTEPDAGEVFWQGTPVRKQRSEFNQQLLFLGHKLGLTPELTAFENLAMLCRLERTASDADIRQALEYVGLGNRVNQPLVTLSAGQQQRVRLALTVLLDTPLWIFDEPLNALDATGQEWLEETLNAHAAKGGCALVTTHQAIGHSAWRSVSMSDFHVADPFAHELDHD